MMADAMRARRYRHVPAIVLLLSGCIESRAQAPSRVANIERAAEEIAVIHDRDGNDGAAAAIAVCYQRELLQASKLTPGLEACMAQDIIVAKKSAGLYALLSPDQRKKAGLLEPDEVTRAIARRIFWILSKLGIPEQDARAFNRIVQMEGMNAYARVQFPKEFLRNK